MPDDWVKQRHRKFQEKATHEATKKTWQENAKQSYPSMFQSLQDRVERDVEVSNEAFPLKLKFSHDAEGFYVVGPGDRKTARHVSAVRTQGTVIKLEFGVGLISDGHRHDDRIEIVADDHDGSVRYRHKGKLLEDVSNASEIILDDLVNAASAT